MYYLILKDLSNDIKIVGNCESAPHKSVIIKNYCLNNDIHLVSCRQDINNQCNGINQMYTYPVLDNRYIVLKCNKHDSNIVFNEYVEKINEGYFEFHFYKPEELKLKNLEIEETLICDEMNKLEKHAKKRYV